MAAPQSTHKGASRWGFLQQAVASVESRLDNILGEEDEAPRKPQPAPPQLSRANSHQKRPSAEIARSGASTPANDRLQARLARAMVQKAGSRPESPLPSSGQEPMQDVPEIDDVPDLDLKDAASKEEARVVVTDTNDDTPAPAQFTPAENSPPLAGLRPSVSDLPTSSLVSSRTSAEEVNDYRSSNSHRPSLDTQLRDPASISIQLEKEEIQRIMQEEIDNHVERIDAMQVKLLYLTKEAADVAKQAANAAQSGSAEKKLLEKDEKIALLLEEGQKLSKQEMKHLTSLRKMRAQNINIIKEHDNTKQRADRAERSLRLMEDRARKAEAASKRAEQNLASSLDATTDFDALTKERTALNATLADIKAQLSRANARAESAEAKADSDHLEKERKRVADLHDDLTSAKVERQLSEEKLRRELKDLQASLEREKEHSRAMETEMLGEQATLESKLESFRARAEEASSSDHGDVQAKLLRQIETLQSQYAAASQNWQGIESSLLGRITNLEKERDDIANRESDLRRKLREATLKTKRTERDLEEAHNRLPDVEKSLIETEEELQRSTRKLKQFDTDLTQARKDLEDSKTQAEKDVLRRIEEEKAKWAASLPTRVESPAASGRKGSGLGFDIAHPLHDRSRRSSALPSHDYTPPRQYSVPSLKGYSNGANPETPPIVTSADIDQDEYFNDVPPTPLSQSHAASPRVGVHDLISTSTVGAGPSVQLVERMSANVRRLESEKAASKDEIVRLTTQRDESRNEVVNLMREVEEKRDVEGKLTKLAESQKELEERHRTTLEMLGEKSELVEELRADVADVKAMYRQLADTMK